LEQGIPSFNADQENWESKIFAFLGKMKKLQLGKKGIKFGWKRIEETKKARSFNEELRMASK